MQALLASVLHAYAALHIVRSILGHIIYCFGQYPCMVVGMIVKLLADYQSIGSHFDRFLGAIASVLQYCTSC